MNTVQRFAVARIYDAVRQRFVEDIVSQDPDLKLKSSIDLAVQFDIVPPEVAPSVAYATVALDSRYAR